jgi:hypothetical protein
MCLNMFSYASLIVMAVIATAILNFSAILQWMRRSAIYAGLGDQQ